MHAPRPQLHLFVDISSHGFGHLAQAAPILNALAALRPELKLTVRCGLPEEKIRSRLRCAFTHLAERSDFGFVMYDAVRIDLEATASAYRAQHADWTQRVADEAALLGRLAPDLVLTDVAYLPLAGAAKLGIPSLAMCSLNWAGLFAHYFGHHGWAAPIHAEILAAYRSAACFLRLTPAMDMPELPRQKAIAPVAALGVSRRGELAERLNAPATEKRVLIAFGGFERDLAPERWPQRDGLHWLVPQSWPVQRADMSAFEPLGLHFTDLLCSVDAVVTKPGYGTFTEAACNGVPVLYVRRNDWPEQDCLIDWLHRHARCAEVCEAELCDGRVHATLAALWQQPAIATPQASGALETAYFLAERLDRSQMTV